MNITPALTAKNFYRFTGPPENWLTAIKYMTWGLEEKYKGRWNNIQTGDIFFIHSTGSGSSLFRNAKSGVIGIGVVGSNFSIKNNYLWIHEFKDQTNKWPLLIPLSEIYLFSNIPNPSTWESPNLNNVASTQALINVFIKDFIPLHKIRGFPQMGSFSSVSNEVAEQILSDKKPLHRYENINEYTNVKTSKPTELKEIKSAAETLRYATTLEIFNSVKTRIVSEGKSQYTKDNELLSKAEITHTTILQQLIDLFKSKGYITMSNKFVDLYTHNEKNSFLFEVKSIENNNFRSQARKGLIQLYEYDYFEVKKFKRDNKINFKNEYQILIPSRVPNDAEYIKFINFLNIGVGVVKKKFIQPVGNDFGFSNI